jgi:hypothetical protein
VLRNKKEKPSKLMDTRRKGGRGGTCYCLDRVQPDGSAGRGASRGGVSHHEIEQKNLNITEWGVPDPPDVLPECVLLLHR